jgi:hypothetical protein
LLFKSLQLHKLRQIEPPPFAEINEKGIDKKWQYKTIENVKLGDSMSKERKVIHPSNIHSPFFFYFD